MAKKAQFKSFKKTAKRQDYVKKSYLQKNKPKIDVIESKYKDTVNTVSGLNITTSQQRLLCSNIGAGTSNSQRIGKNITLKSVQWKTLLYQGNNSYLRNYKIRQLLVYDKSPDGTMPYLIGITGDPTPLVTTGGGNNDLLSFPQIDYKDRFIIISDKMYDWSNADNSAAEDVNMKSWEKYKKLNIPVEYAISANTGDYGDHKVGALILYTICSSDLVGGDPLRQPTITTNVRLKYIDL